MFFATTFVSVLALAASALGVSTNGIVEELTAFSNISSTLISVVKTQPDILNALSSAKGPITLFAPTNDAFAAALKAGLNASDSALVADVLTYHVVPNVVFTPNATLPRQFVQTLRKNPLNFNKPTDLRVDFDGKEVVLSFGLASSKVVQSNFILNGNGVIHFVDTVLTPPEKTSATAVAAKLTALVGALTATKTVDVVDSLQGVTILAPVDAAFEAIASTVKTLTADNITAVLEFHVIPGVYYSTDLVAAGAKLAGIPTYLGQQTLTETNDGKTVSVAGPSNSSPAKVAIADVLIANGVVHVIDTVLLPDLKNLIPSPPTQITPSSPSPSATVSTTPSPSASAKSSAGSVKAGVAGVFMAVAAVLMF
ncbi:hypothetical protein HDU76_011213 [Blyttiomyces sp. JEL0837]|nr:hypothetical protein HDU76_011213 [Blyttiomyces sp. JEL0837]